MTSFVKKSELKNDWYLIDGNNAVVGRLASIIAKILRGTMEKLFESSIVAAQYQDIALAGKRLQG